MKHCCRDCFKDENLRAEIERQGSIGTCDWCGSEAVPVLEPYELHDLFHPLLVSYEQKPPFGDCVDSATWGSSLAESIENDGWKIFSDCLELEDQNSLLDAIRYEDPDQAGWRAGCGNWLSLGKGFAEFTAEEIWRKFADHIRWKRRFLPQPDKYGFLSEPKDWLPPLLADTELFVKPDSVLFRTRIGHAIGDGGLPAPLERSEMGPPPREIATRGRANPAGIPYLYTADLEMTAVAEVRPHVGAHVTVCELRPKQELRIADLTRIHQIHSPFLQLDIDNRIRKNALLNRLNSVLSEPVDPKASEIEYVPSQYLAEVILNAGYDGIRYQSAIFPTGMNIVFFDAAGIEIDEKTRLVTVKGMTLNCR